MNKGYFVIEGNIGSGKTSLANKIVNDLGGQIILERFEDNPFLPKFYDEPAKYAFPLEMSFLADRYSQMSQNLISTKTESQFIVSDYYFTKSLIFARNTLAEDEFQLYQRFFNIVYDKISKPDLYVYLDVNVEKLLENIRKRGRDYEQNIKASYLEKITQGYLDYLTYQQQFPVLIVDINDIDFVNNEEDYRKLIGIIFDSPHRTGITRILVDKK